MQIPSKSERTHTALSVAMCTYNGETYIAEQLRSLRYQTQAPDELVICDDHSTDGTVDIVRAESKQLPFPVRLFINRSRLGVAKNFERAIRLCDGAYVALADQDDVWHPEKLRLSVAALEANPNAGFVFSNAEVVDEHLSPLGYTMWDFVLFGSSERRLVQRGHAFDLLLHRFIVTGATMVFRSELRDLCLPIPIEGRWMHDGWLAVLIAAVADVVFVDQPTMLYRQHHGQQIGVQKASGDSSLWIGEARRSTALMGRRAEHATDDLIRLHDRLRAASSAFDVGPATEALLDEIQHLEARDSLPALRLARVPTVLNELVSRRYRRYSQGILSAAKDVFLP